MKGLLFVLLFLVSCQNEPKTMKLSHVKEMAKNTFSKAVGEGVAYKVFSLDSSFVYGERFAKVVVDSSDDYTELYANAFLSLTNKKILPSEKAIKKEIGNYVSKPQLGESNSKIQKEQGDAFDLVNSKSEHIGEHVNTMDLYVSKNSFDIDALKHLCSKRKSEFTNGFFSYIVIFDSKKNAAFPKTPLTGLYGLDGKTLIHIKAVYEYNAVNGYSKLTTYEKNKWESVAVDYNIN